MSQLNWGVHDPRFGLDFRVGKLSSMSAAVRLKKLAAKFGFNVERLSHKPSHTLMGLKNYDFKIVFDIGANRGQFASDFLSHFPKANFYCFEPLPHAFADLQLLALKHGNLTPVQLALGETEGNVEMNLHSDHDTSSSLLETTSRNLELYPVMQTQNKVVVKVERLDDYVKKLAVLLSGDIFMKLDVQGHEAAVLRGSRNTLKHAKACLIEVNVEELYVGQSSFLEIAKLMDEVGLKYIGNFEQAYDSDGRVIFFDALFARN